MGSLFLGFELLDNFHLLGKIVEDNDFHTPFYGALACVYILSYGRTLSL